MSTNLFCKSFGPSITNNYKHSITRYLQLQTFNWKGIHKAGTWRPRKTVCTLFLLWLECRAFYSEQSMRSISFRTLLSLWDLFASQTPQFPFLRRSGWFLTLGSSALCSHHQLHQHHQSYLSSTRISSREWRRPIDHVDCQTDRTLRTRHLQFAKM